MKNYSFLKISFALAIISLYVYLFGVMDIVDGNLPLVVDVSETGGEVSDGELLPSETDVISLNVANGRMPRLQDYEVPVVLPPVEVQATEPPVVTAAPVTSKPAVTLASRVTAAETVGATEPPSENAPTPSTQGAGDDETLIDNNPIGSTGTFRISSGGGNTVEGDAFDIVSRVVQAEIGSAFHKEAIKAQAVTVYTYIKRQNKAGNAPVLPISHNASERVKECTRDVWEKAVYYDGELIQAVYCASSAGWSASAETVWGSELPYLKGGKRDFDEQHDPNWGQTVTFASNEIMTNVLKHTGIQLSGEPSEWLKIQNHVDTVYVGTMSIGGKTTYTSNGDDVKITGRVFREKIMGFALRSASFTFSYDKDKDIFTFTTNGYGHGAGMSQNGANILATHNGYSYTDIIKYYYTGVEIR